MASKGKGKGAPPPPKVRTTPPKTVSNPPPKAGGVCGMAQLLQKTENVLETMEKNNSLEIEGVDLSSIDETAKAETVACPRCEKLIRVLDLPSHMTSHSSEILPWLFLGGSRNADNGKELTVRTGITHILNLAHECMIDRDARKEIEAYNQEHNVPFVYKKIEWYDVDGQDILPYLQEAIGFIHDSHNADSTHHVLVHCVQGISRSASVVVAYLMKYEGMSLREAHKFVKERRSIAEPRKTFVDQLGDFEKQIYGISAPTLTGEEAFEGVTQLKID